MCMFGQTRPLSYLTLQFVMVLLKSLRSTTNGLVNLSSPVDLVHTDHHLTGPLTHPLDTRIHCIGLHLRQEVGGNGNTEVRHQ